MRPHFRETWAGQLEVELGPRLERVRRLPPITGVVPGRKLPAKDAGGCFKGAKRERGLKQRICCGLEGCVAAVPGLPEGEVGEPAVLVSASLSLEPPHGCTAI